MTARRYLQLDVFSSAPGQGNPLGVVTDATDLDGTQMQRLAAWLNLSETIFFLPPDASGADYRIRIFTPKGELPFAGHPSVGAAWAAIELGLARPRDGTLIQQCAAGLLPVQIADRSGTCRVHVRSPHALHRDLPIPRLPPRLMAAAAGRPPELWNNGPDWWLLELKDEAALRTMTPELEAISALPVQGKLAAFAFSDAEDYQLAVRAFAPSIGVSEDPVTGSANALIAAYLVKEDRLPGMGRYIVSQGRELGRDGRIEIQVDGEGKVWIGGQVQPVIDRHLDW